MRVWIIDWLVDLRKRIWRWGRNGQGAERLPKIWFGDTYLGRYEVHIERDKEGLSFKTRPETID